MAGQITEGSEMTDETKGRLVMQRAKRERMGFLTKEDIEKIAHDPTTRLTLLLVRCGGGRFLAPAQDVQHFVDIVEANGGDYVRDVSVPVERG